MQQMKPAFRIMGGLAVFLLALLLASGCATPGTTPPGTVRAAVTIPPQEEMAREIGGDHVVVTVMMPPGADPHTYEPGPGTVAEAAGADLYLALGTGLLPIEESVVTRIRAMNPSVMVVDSSEGITRLYAGTEAQAGSSPDQPGQEGGPGQGSPDPHIWLSLRNAAIMAGNTRDALIAVDPTHEQEYRENCAGYVSRLNDLDQRISRTFAGDDPGILIVTHPAWGYFARDYGIELVAIEDDGKEPTARDLEALILHARSAGARVVFAEAQESPREAEIVAREIGGTVRVIDPLARDYLANMERVSGAFSGAGTA